MGNLEGKVVVVTGSSREIAKALSLEGGRVICAGRTLHEGDYRLEGSLETTVAAIRGAGGEASPVAVDIAKPEECQRLVMEARRIYGPVDVLVNNAAYIVRRPVKDFPLDLWMETWAVSFQAVFLLSKLVLEDMVPRRGGRIVNISSGAAAGPGRGPYRNRPTGPGGTNYGATKAAMERFTQGLAQEVDEYGIAVTAVSPSVNVPTPRAREFQIGVGRSPDDPRDEPAWMIAKAVLLLATEPAEKVNGRVCYSQQLLKEYGLIQVVHGLGTDPDRPGSGYSRA
jgi:NAD(P)-dependent dehydrogenase (short-subunit alcohol dehydrogenase family)